MQDAGNDAEPSALDVGGQMDGFDQTTNPVNRHSVTADAHCASQNRTKSPAARGAAKFHAA